MQGLRIHTTLILLIATSLAMYFSLALDTPRTDLLKLTGLYAALAYLGWKLSHAIPASGRTGFWIGIGFRLVFFTSLPAMSQDFYRFLWDGALHWQGMNPYDQTPEAWMNTPGFHLPLANTLFEGMGTLSASHYSNYPPLNQLFFALAAGLGGNSLFLQVLVLRLCILAGDIAVFFGIRKILHFMKLPASRAYWYWFNPLIILEGTGNLHFEILMMACTVWGLFWLLREKWVAAALCLGAGISLKLLPALLLPATALYVLQGWTMQRRFWIKSVLFTLTALAVFLLSFLPYSGGRNFLTHFAESVGLWFGKFEFNASIYYLVREVGYWKKGYNIIQDAAPVLSSISTGIIVLLALLRKNWQPQTLMTTLLWSLTAYLFLSTTVHPWYLITPLIISLFTPYRYMLLWSLTVILSYHAYAQPQYQEVWWMLLLGYLPVYAMWGKEVYENLKAS